MNRFELFDRADRVGLGFEVGLLPADHAFGPRRTGQLDTTCGCDLSGLYFAGDDLKRSRQ